MPADPFPWCRRLFASVDLIGSTSFKQRSPENSGVWAHVFRRFFDEFPTKLAAAYKGPSRPADGKPLHELRVWKYVGDEILFEVELSRHEEAVHHVLALRDALNGIAAEYRQKHDLTQLGFKGTIWGAGFPVTNTEVRCQLHGGSVRDYIGPCVDQGFRLCTLADSRCIPISVDIAFMLAMTACSPNTPLYVHCEEPKQLKGVSKPYPHFWVDRTSGAPTEEDKLLQRRVSHKPAALREYLYELFSRDDAPHRKPFIVSDPSGEFNLVPDDMKMTRDRIISSSAESTYTPEYRPPELEAQKADPPKIANAQLVEPKDVAVTRQATGG